MIKLSIGDGMDLEEFSKRLSTLRINKDVSARNMSLSIGQSAGYINNIENNVSLPSMETFFYICEYLGISEQEFFDIENANPIKTRELLSEIKGLDNEQIDSLLTIIRGLKS